MKRVAITGCGAVSPFGQGVDTMIDALKAGRSAVRILDNLSEVKGLRTNLGATVPPIETRVIPRKLRRYMSDMSIHATLAAYEAVEQAKLEPSHLENPRAGVSIGSTTGSPLAVEEFFGIYLREHGLENLKSTYFFRIMNHSAAANVAQALGIRGRIVSPSAACATATQAIGLAYETVAAGRQDIMICGGADELHPLTIGVFDIMNATAITDDLDACPMPRPFDKARGGVVCAEGSGILVLESFDSAEKRGVPILAEIIGFATNSDSGSIARPSPEPLVDCMRQALEAAQLSPEAVDYVNAHATGTEFGDLAEGRAIAQVVGPETPVSSLKGHMGHTLAACGALELSAVLAMLQGNYIIPTLNLAEPDPDCGNIRHVTQCEERTLTTVLKNSFALGGVNATILVRMNPHG